MRTNILDHSSNLDLLRAVAVTFVVVDHTAKFMGHPYILGCDMNWLGRLGVMFFFLHTCAVLMLSLERLHTGASEVRVRASFCIRRVFRIYPLSIFAVAFVSLTHIPAYVVAGTYTILTWKFSFSQLLGNLLLVQNVLPRHSDQVLTVLWSLPYEVQMYLILPFLFSWAFGVRRTWPLAAMWFLVWVPAHFIKPLMFMPHFLSGVIAYSLSLRRRDRLVTSWAFPLLIAVATSFFFMSHETSYALGGILCFILGVALPFIAPISLEFVNRITKQIAKFSYGVYIAHVPCLWFAHAKVPAFQWPVYLALLSAVPVALYYGIEGPLMKFGASIADKISHLSRRGSSIETFARTAP